MQCPFAFLDSGNSYPLHYERGEPLCRLLRKLNASLILMMRPWVACPCSSCLPSVVDMGTCPEAPRLSARNADRQLCAFISYGSTSQRRAAQCYTNILDICRVCASATEAKLHPRGLRGGRSWRLKVLEDPWILEDHWTIWDAFHGRSCNSSSIQTFSERAWGRNC